MNKNNDSEKVIKSIVLDNGLRVTFFDLSKNVAADRWLVKIKCEAVYEIPDEFFDLLDDAGMASAMKKDWGGAIRHCVFRERNFVDEHEMEAARQELFEHLYDNARSYMGRELFTQKLYEKKVEEFRLKYRMQKELEQMAVPDDDDDGPADFSACFRD